jgi:tRNA-2-methylthio-N6-dimethylallyladenosine synthase
MRSSKYFIETYGCEMNKSDSVDIALSLEADGYTEAARNEDADVVVLNTCSVREHAEERIHGRLGYYRSLSARRNGSISVVLAGCMAQEQGVRIIERFPEVKAVVGTYHGWSIPEALRRYAETGLPVVLVDQEHYEFSPFKGQRARGHSAFVNIIMGCSNFCTYCIVPYLRGPEKSKPAAQVIDEVRELADRGVVEITLLGQNVNVYGEDCGGPGFVELLERIHDVEGIRWIRFLTSHPRDFDEGIVRRIAGMEKVCRHLHLPLQSGSDRVLRLMRRQYDMRHYRTVVDAVRMNMDDASITTDIIVGFPTETEEDFQQTLAVVREVGYDDAFTYRYSARPFTEALRISDPVEPDTACRRLEELIEVQRSISLRRSREQIGKTRRALVERTSKKNSREMLCKTERNRMVVVRTTAPVGSFIEVSLKGLSGSTLRGCELRP